MPDVAKRMAANYSEFSASCQKSNQGADYEK